MLAMVTIEPRSPPTGSCSSIWATACLATRNVPVRFTSMTCCQSVVVDEVHRPAAGHAGRVHQRRRAGRGGRRSPATSAATAASSVTSTGSTSAAFGDVGPHHRGALGAQPSGGRLTDPRGGPRDQRDLPIDATHRDPLPLRTSTHPASRTVVVVSLHLAVDELVLLAAGVVVLGVLIAGLAGRFRVPSLLVFLAVGMVVGDDGLALVRFDDAELAQSIAVIALVLILFEGGLSASPTRIREVAAPAAMLATVGVGITAAVVAGAGILLLDLEANTAWLLGAVVASTDAAAILSILRGAPVPRRISTLLEAESGLNDPVAILLTVGVLETWAGDATAGGWVVFGLRQLAVGAAVGVIVGRGGAWLASHAHLGSASLNAVLGSGLAGLAYGVAASLGGSGLLAVFLAGLLLGRVVAPPARPRHGARGLRRRRPDGAVPPARPPRVPVGPARRRR